MNFTLFPELNTYLLPRHGIKAKSPPINYQGSKTKLVPFIASSIRWHGRGRWIEPFVGSGAVVFNLAPERALLGDTNVHVIRFYRAIATRMITPEKVRTYLEREGKLLSERGEEHYYAVRQRFNVFGHPLDFLFLNRTCYNGLIRFNRYGEFNVPFCKRPDRFSPAFIKKVVDQVAWVAGVLKSKKWEFVVADWRDTLSKATEDDFVYADPPYPDRHNDYYTSWNEEDTKLLFETLQQLPCGYALSTWVEDERRQNTHVLNLPENVTLKTYAHKYHVGPRVENRIKVLEALVVPVLHAV